MISLWLCAQLMSVCQRKPRQFSRLTVDSCSSSPLFSVEPTFCSAAVYPDVPGSDRRSSRSVVFSLYQSTVPVTRLPSTPNSTPTSFLAVFSQPRFGFAGLFGSG